MRLSEAVPVTSYNGFSPNERAAFAKWRAAEMKAGRIAPPTRCAACGQTGGVIDHHAEDYSKPWSEAKNIPPEMQLCFPCHMMLHSRFSNPASWMKYVAAIREGKQYGPCHVRDMGLIRRLCGPGAENVPFIWFDVAREEIAFDTMNLRATREA